MFRTQHANYGYANTCQRTHQANSANQSGVGEEHVISQRGNIWYVGIIGMDILPTYQHTNYTRDYWDQAEHTSVYRYTHLTLSIVS